MSETSNTSSRATTGLFTHSQIRHLMRVEFGRAQRYRYTLACLQISVDRIEQLRDLYGYESKETILDDVVRLLQEGTRGCDYLGRSTDDRLLVVMPHTDGPGAESAATRLIESARRLGFEAEGRRLQVTISVGASHFGDENTLFFDSLVDASEAALRDAMDGGGDRYVYREPSSA